MLVAIIVIERINAACMNTNASQQPPSFKQACQQLIQPYGHNTTWVIGVSGGVDSTVLLHTLAQLKKSFPVNLVACYVDHQWRKPPAAEIEPLWQQTQAWEIPLVIAPIPANTPKTETAARDARQQAFMAVVQRFNAKGVILAHHADDQWETLLLRLFRGTGPNGLQGIQPISTVDVGDEQSLTILHPFLHFNKDDLRTTAEMFELKWIEDTTNSDNHHKRNALRNEVIPAIEKHFPNIGDKLNQLATIATQQTQLANDAINIAWNTVWNGASLDMAAFFQLDPAYQTGLMMKLLSHHGLPVNKKTLDTLATFLTSDDPQHSQSQQCSIEGPEGSDAHWFFTIRKHRGFIRNSGEEILNPVITQDVDTDDELIYGLPVKFRLAQLFPTWAGVGPANADNNDTGSELDINDRLSATSQLDDDGDDNNDYDETTPDTEDDTTDLANELDSELDNDDDDDVEDLDGDELDDSDDTDTETDTDLNNTSDEGDSSTDSDDTAEDEATADAVVTLHTTRIQVIDLPEYQAELEIARLGPDEVIPSPLPPANSLTVYANLKPLVNDHLTIRYRRPSDRIHPIGMIAGMPIKNYFISQGIPPEQRSRQPLLCCQTDVLWAVGLGLNELLRANKKPTHRLTWRSVAPPPQTVSQPNNHNESESANAPSQLVTV